MDNIYVTSLQDHQAFHVDDDTQCDQNGMCIDSLSYKHNLKKSIMKSIIKSIAIVNNGLTVRIQTKSNIVKEYNFITKFQAIKYYHDIAS